MNIISTPTKTRVLITIAKICHLRRGKDVFQLFNYLVWWPRNEYWIQRALDWACLSNTRWDVQVHWVNLAFWDSGLVCWRCLKWEMAHSVPSTNAIVFWFLFIFLSLKYPQEELTSHPYRLGGVLLPRGKFSSTFPCLCWKLTCMTCKFLFFCNMISNFIDYYTF